MRHQARARARRARRSGRRGSVTVELAVVAPLFVLIIFGIIESSRILEMHNLIALASREGARLASLEREDLLLEGETTNSKVTADIKNYLHALGFKRSAIDVAIMHVDSNEPFDLDDNDNEFGLFRIRVEVPYCDTCSTPIEGLEGYVLAGEITFRNGRVPG